MTTSPEGDPPEVSHPSPESDERAEMLARARDALARDAHGEAAEALTAVLALSEANEVGALVRIALLHERAGQIGLARDWIDRARWEAPEDPGLAAHLARLSAAQGDALGVAEAQRWAPGAAAVAWRALGEPERALALSEQVALPPAEERGLRAEDAARRADEAALVERLREAWTDALARLDGMGAMLAGGALEGLSALAPSEARRLEGLRPRLWTHPVRSLSAPEWARLGLEAPRPAQIEGPELPAPARAATRSVAMLLGGTAVSKGWRLEAGANLRFGLAASALVAVPQRVRDRVGLLAAVDPGPPVRAASSEDRLALAARVLDPEHRGLLERLGLGVAARPAVLAGLDKRRTPGSIRALS